VAAFSFSVRGINLFHSISLYPEMQLKSNRIRPIAWSWLKTEADFLGG